MRPAMGRNKKCKALNIDIQPKLKRKVCEKMNINIQNLAKRIPPALCALLILLTLIVPAIPAQAAETYTLSGTWKYNDTLSTVSERIEQPVNAYFSFGIDVTQESIDSADSELIAIGLSTDLNDMVVGHYDLTVTFSSIVFAPDGDYVTLGYHGASYISMPSSSFLTEIYFGSECVEAYSGLHYGWDVNGYPSPDERFVTFVGVNVVSAEFYEVFTANASPVVEQTEIYISIKDSASNVLHYGYGLGPAKVKVMDGGIAVYFADGAGSFAYAYTGVGYFAGVRTGSTFGTLYEAGDEFELTDGVPLYVEVGYAVEFRDAETNELLGYNQGQLPMSIGMEAKSIYIYYENRTATVQSIAVDKGLQIAGWSTSLFYESPQYDLGEVVDFDGHATIYIHWADAPVTDPAPDLPIGPDTVDTPEWVDPGINDVYEDIFHQKENVSSAIDKIGNIGANVSLDKYNFDMDVFIGSAFPNVSTVLSTIVGEGFMPQIWTSLGLALIVVVILFGSDR